MELRTIQDWIVKRQMALVPGVVEVNAFGGYVKQYEVAINPDKLKSFGITMGQVFEALKVNNANTGGAYIEKNHQANFIRGEGLASSLEDLENTVVTTQNGTPVLVRDIAQKVGYGNQVRYGAFTQDGHESVGGQILMLKGESPSNVINNVDVNIETDGEMIKAALIKQLYSPVRWSETITALGEQGINQMVEVGPGKVLQGLVKRINKSIKCISFNSDDTLNKAKELTQTVSE